MKKLIIFSFLITFYIVVGAQNIGQVQGKKTIKVITYNTHHCSPPATGGIDIGGIADVITSSNADIVFLEEIDNNVVRSGNIDEAKLLADKTNLPYFHFFKAIDLSGGEYGVAILSKFPLNNPENHTLALQEGTEQRVFGTAIVDITNVGKIMIGVGHLDLNSEYRLIQVKQIDSILSKTSLPVIFGGDFNAEPESNEIKYLLQKFKSSTEVFVPTFPNVNPTKTIDYIFTDPKHTKCFNHTVISDINASDHLPVLTSILLF